MLSCIHIMLTCCLGLLLQIHIVAAASDTAAGTADAAEDASSLLASAAVPRSEHNTAEAAGTSTSGRPQQQQPSLLSGAFSAVGRALQQTREHSQQQVVVSPLPLKRSGGLIGGQYPFLYDPVYGLPIVREVARYGEVLRDIRQGEVAQVGAVQQQGRGTAGTAGRWAQQMWDGGACSRCRCSSSSSSSSSSNALHVRRGAAAAARLEQHMQLQAAEGCHGSEQLYVWQVVCMAAGQAQQRIMSISWKYMRLDHSTGVSANDAGASVLAGFPTPGTP
jgi:hypothetical protein